jgi:Fe-Mn family superoxide dismutase
MAYEVPKLTYEYDALEPFIDAETMKIHHSKHHAAYVAKLNAALDGNADLAGKPVEALMTDLSSVPEAIRGAVRNHGGGHLNHSFFWQLLKKDVPFDGEIAQAVTSKFGSFEDFKQKFVATGLGVFGSGWAWLVLNGSDIEIVGTPNQDTPLSTGKTPLLGVDVWEHAYYLKYQNRRPEYLEAIFSVLDWNAISKNLVNARQSSKATA